MKSVAKQYVQDWATSFRDGVQAWRNFWFDPADAFTLGIIRLLTGWMLVYNLLVWGSDLQAFFGVNGLQPLQTILDFHGSEPVFSFWFYVPEAWITTAHWCCVSIALMFFLGIGTRVTSVLAFLITISYSQRVPIANFGLDQILGMLCLYLAIGPSGTCLSVDSWWRSRRRKAEGKPVEIQRLSSARMALRLIQLHLCAIYFWAGIAKLKGDSWYTGEAMWQVMANQEYQTMDLTWMAAVPWLPYLVAHVTVIWEVSFIALVWNKTLRPWILAIGTGMHFGIGAFLGMWTFGLIMTYAYFSFSDPAAWRRRIHWLLRIPETAAAPITRSVSTTAPATAIAQTASSAAMAAAAPVATLPEGDLNAVDPGEPFDFSLPGNDEFPVPDSPGADSSSVNSPSNDSSAPSSELPLSPSQELIQPSTADLDREYRRPEINTPAIPRPEPAVRNSFTDGFHRTGEMENVALNPESALLLVTLSKQERNTLRRYFRQHEILCRAATTPENGLTLATTIKPVAVLVAGTQMQSEELATLLEDLEDISEAPILALTSRLQSARLQELGLNARTLLYPVSPREIREELAQLVFGDEKQREPKTPSDSHDEQPQEDVEA